MQDLSNFLAYMRFNDQLDNDFDDQDSSGAGLRVVWHDYDKNGGIRWDYDESAAMTGYTGTPRNAEGLNIGHPLHRMLHPQLYVRFSDEAWTKRMIASDTSKNARKATMIKHCQDAARTLDVNGLVTPAVIADLVAQTCVTFTSILKSTVRPPARSDWRRGTFGIDEEMIDDRDNDYDGLKDEDARNAAGMDDDDDAQLTIAMIGTEPAPMVWADAAGHENKCPDIDLDKPMQAAPLSRQFCIGSLEHRIYLAQTRRHGNAQDLLFQVPGRGRRPELPGRFRQASGGLQDGRGPGLQNRHRGPGRLPVQAYLDRRHAGQIRMDPGRVRHRRGIAGRSGQRRRRLDR